VPEAAERRLPRDLAGRLAAGACAWTEAEHRITRSTPTTTWPPLLEIDAGAACLVVERRTWRGDEHITYVRQTFAGDAYDLVAKFGPSNLEFWKTVLVVGGGIEPPTCGL
jgi:GntR family histidine utilization transcriptional repressor